MTSTILWVAAALGVLERSAWTRFRAQPFWRPYLGTDAVYLATGYVAAGALGFAWLVLASGQVAALTGLRETLWPRVPWPLQVFAALVAIDLGNYVCHWALHRVDALWAFHEAHHSSRTLDWMATFRSHLGEQAFRRLVSPVGVIALAMPIDAVAAAAVLFLAWAMTNHANVRLPLGWAEGLLVTPKLHRHHHVPATTERNLGAVFTWWDRVRGTLVTGEIAPEAGFGLPRDRDTYPQAWDQQLVAPFVRLWPRRRLAAGG
jgi:sterol desaturase/sphingolipid hydroxylase (fatty acid hydroxylase superfamily)